MRRIEVLDDVFVRFPGRGDEFDLGIEIGSLCVRMATGEPLIQRHLSAECLEQLRPLAERFRYALVATPAEEGFETSLIHWSSRPKLRVVR
jgi:hypothetical protein